jgi:hypothetical protein
MERHNKKFCGENLLGLEVFPHAALTLWPTGGMMSEVELFEGKEFPGAIFEALTQIKKEPVKGYFYFRNIRLLKIRPNCSIF